MMKQLYVKLPALLLTLIVSLMASSTAFGTALIVIENVDAPGVGFNDTTPVAQVGGNPGITLGEQRLKAFEFAAAIWGATLTSPTITIRASWAELPCIRDEGTLGSASAISIRANFPGALFTNTFYSVSLANALSNSDLNGSTAEIRAQFNSKLGTSGCLEDLHWYYGLDTNTGFRGVNLVTVLLHEFGHGLGFQSFTDLTDDPNDPDDLGSQLGGFPSIYNRFLFDNTAGKTWAQMTNSERAASATNTNNLAWNGPQVVSDAATVLTSGKDSTGCPLVFTPNTLQEGSSVSHWGTIANPNQLMEPNISNGLSHSVMPPQDLTFSLMRDIGWCSGCPQPPPPSPTPIPSPPPNNDFASAQIISGCTGSVTGTNIGANKEAGELSHSPDNNAGGGSVWFQWQAPSSGSVTITTAGSTNDDTVLAVYTGDSVSSLTVVLRPDGTPAKNDDVDPGVIRTSTVTFNATSGTVYKIAVDGWDNERGDIVLNWTQSGCSAMIFSTAAYSVNESAGSVTLTVARTDTTGAASVDYKTTDSDTFTVGCADTVNNLGGAYGRCDYATSVDTLNFLAGETTKTFAIPIIDDGHVEGPETFQVVLSNPSTGLTLGTPATATVTINDNDTAGTPNPILASDDAGIAFFVRQHYLDFLAREPEVGEPWSAILRGCADQFNFDPTSPSAGCDRITVSGSFFGSPEFLNKGIYVIVFYRVAFNRLPQYVEFAPDLRSVTGPTQAETFAKRATFANNFVLRPEFVSQYAALSNQDYVNALMGRYSLSSITTPDPANPDGPVKVTLTSADLTNRLNGVGGTLTRAQVLRAIVQSDQVSGNLEAVNAFVASQYYGYLRRTPDTGGFNGWVTHLSQHPNDFRTMVNGFVNSIEYRLRFGP